MKRLAILCADVYNDYINGNDITKYQFRGPPQISQNIYTQKEKSRPQSAWSNNCPFVRPGEARVARAEAREVMTARSGFRPNSDLGMSNRFVGTRF